MELGLSYLFIKTYLIWNLINEDLFRKDSRVFTYVFGDSLDEKNSKVLISNYVLGWVHVNEGWRLLVKVNLEDTATDILTIETFNGFKGISFLFEINIGQASCCSCQSSSFIKANVGFLKLDTSNWTILWE